MSIEYMKFPANRIKELFKGGVVLIQNDLIMTKPVVKPKIAIGKSF